MAATTTQPALQVDVVPGKYSENVKDRVDLAISVINLLIIGILIPVFLWWYGRKQEKALQEQTRQQQAAAERQAEQQRLQAHVSRLSDTDAMHVIGDFKTNCEYLGLSYATVFAAKKPVCSGDISITRCDILAVNFACKQLQGIWDNIIDDYRAGQLGAPITDARHSRMLRRGVAYMELVEPLEAANWACLQQAWHTSQGPYVLPHPDQPAEAAASPATAPQAATVVEVSSAVSAPQFLEGARASRFRWLENQQVLQLIKQPLWQEEKVAVSHSGATVNTRLANDDALQKLAARDAQLLKSLQAHWDNVRASYSNAAAVAARAAIATATCDGANGCGTGSSDLMVTSLVMKS